MHFMSCLSLTQQANIALASWDSCFSGHRHGDRTIQICQQEGTGKHGDTRPHLQLHPLPGKQPWPKLRMPCMQCSLSKVHGSMHAEMLCRYKCLVQAQWQYTIANSVHMLGGCTLPYSVGLMDMFTSCCSAPPSSVIAFNRHMGWSINS